MRHPQVDNDPFLAMIDARLAALQQLRASYLAAQAAGAIGQAADAVPPLLPAAPVPAEAIAEEADADQLAADLSPRVPQAAVHSRAPLDAVPTPVPAAADDGRKRGRGIGEAVQRCLAAAVAPRSVKEIGRELRLQGVVSKAASIEATIASALHRLKQHGEALRTARGWVLQGNDAALQAADTAPPAQRRVPRRAPRPRRPPSEPAADRQEGGLAWRIESLLKSHGQPVAARYVANATGEPVNVVGLALGRMVRQQRVEKQSDGRFAVVVPIDEPVTVDEPVAVPEQPEAVESAEST